jgi:hypothetical protein
MLKRFPVVVVAIVAMVALIAGGVVSAVDVINPDLDPNENPDTSLEVDPEENIGVDPEPGTEADPEADPEPGDDEDAGVTPEPGLDDEEGLDPGDGEEPDGDEDLEGEDEEDEDDEDIVSNIFALNIIQAYPELNLTEADVAALRQAGFGWGEISIACGIAVNSGESLDNIVALVSEGTGWGEIAESLGMEGRAFGQYVRGVIGKGHAYGKNEDKQSELDDAASMDMVIEGYGLSEQDVTDMIELGYSAKDVLCAVSLVASTGEAANLELVLRLRTEKQNWSQVAKELGVEDNDMPARMRAHNRVELKEALKQAVKEQVREQKNKNNTDNKGNEGNKDNKNNKDKAKPSNSGKPDHAGIPGQGAKSSEKDKDKGSSGK